ncbi:hypothetical protein B1218_33965, partial [Pseudomonas ogarae]
EGVEGGVGQWTRLLGGGQESSVMTVKKKKQRKTVEREGWEAGEKRSGGGRRQEGKGLRKNEERQLLRDGAGEGGRLWPLGGEGGRETEAAVWKLVAGERARGGGRDARGMQGRTS